MKNSSILIVVGKDASLVKLAEKLESIRAIPARAVILVVEEMPTFPYYAVGVPPYGVTDVPTGWQDELFAKKAALSSKVDAIEALLAQHDVSGEVVSAAGEMPRLAQIVAQKATFVDLVLVNEDLREWSPLFKQVVHGVLFQSPVGVLLNDNSGAGLKEAERVLVAWNMGLHAARAVHQALPILRQAKEVIIASVDPEMTEFLDGEDPGVDVAKWLTHHGCNVVVQQYPSGGKDISDCLLSRANEVGADLIVMGAYGHSRAREALFGGTTRTMMEQTKQPVFLVH